MTSATKSAFGRGAAFVREEMRPGAHQDLDGTLEMFGDAERRVAEQVRPAAEETDRHLYVGVIASQIEPRRHISSWV
jgi:hypothetical protein